MSPFTPYHEESAKYAMELTRNCKSQYEKYVAVTKWVKKCITYDYIRAILIPKRGKEVPDIDRVWKKRRGICMDVAALTVNMLRSVGVPSKFCMGKADGRAHAWVETIIGNKTYRFDHNGKANTYVKEHVFT